MDEQLNIGIAKFQKEAYIFLEGERNVAGQFFIIREGKVRLSRSVQLIDDEPNVLEAGDIFGAVSAMANRCHIETARALTDCTLLAASKNQFGLLIQKNAAVATKIMMQFSKRLRHLNEALTGISIDKNAAVDAEHILSIAEYYAKNNKTTQAFYAYNQYVLHCPNAAGVNSAQTFLNTYAALAKSPLMNFITEGTTRTYVGGAMIFIEGEPGNDAFVIKSGRVKIAKVTENGEILLAILNPGDIFGEMAILDSSPRGASAIALEECQLMMINRANFEPVIRTQPQLVERVTVMLADRMWSLYKQLANTKIADPVGRMTDMLLINLEKKQVHLDRPLSYTFDFGLDELANMIGMKQIDAVAHTDKLLQSRLIEMIDGKIFVPNVQMFTAKAIYYRKMMQKSENERRVKEKKMMGADKFEKDLAMLEGI